MAEEESDNGFFFGSSSSAQVAHSAVARRVEVEAVAASAFDRNFEAAEPELVAAAARPQFAEMSEEPTYTPLPRDYASDFGSGMRGGAEAEEHRAQPATALFTEGDEETHRDLDTPAFLRRLRF
jgi:hypothetical protein